MSTLEDVTSFVAFVREFFVQDVLPEVPPPVVVADVEPPTSSRLYVESLAVYPIKSCAAFSVPPGEAWEVRPEGLVWDRK
jgi:molybdenum cofactor sulfurtransferase